MKFRNRNTGEVYEGRKDTVVEDGRRVGGVFLTDWWPGGPELWIPRATFDRHWEEVKDERLAKMA